MSDDFGIMVCGHGSRDENAVSEFAVVAEAMRTAGYDVIVSIGEVEENEIGSNCGQYVLKYLEKQEAVQDGYTYTVQEVAA